MSRLSSISVTVSSTPSISRRAVRREAPGSVGGPVAAISEWEDGMITRLIYQYDTDEARAAAERLAEERG
jgi:hypothetical protein